MKITLLAHTTLEQFPEDVTETMFGARVFVNAHDTDSDVLGEFAGRACYQAWDMPNPKTRVNSGYLANIINQGHFSVLEHASATFYAEGVSRSLTHELIRHRHLSYSELSQRYVDMAEAPFIVPPALQHNNDGKSEMPMGDDVIETYNDVVNYLVNDKGVKRKQAREAARAFMPNATETKIVVTGNMRAWRDMLAKRWHVAADAEIREFAGEILSHLKTIAPNSFQDVPNKPYGSEDQ